jgi:hypothetical protein
MLQSRSKLPNGSKEEEKKSHLNDLYVFVSVHIWVLLKSELSCTDRSDLLPVRCLCSSGDVLQLQTETNFVRMIQYCTAQ